MASKRKRGSSWEYVIKAAGVLDKPRYMTFASEAEGDAWVARVEAGLKKGIIPGEMRTEARVFSVQDLVREYERHAHPSDKDKAALGTILKTHRGGTPLLNITAAWVDEWISEMKRIDRVAPATIRAKVGALARCTDWGMRQKYLTMPDHPFRSLPDGYAQYTKEDRAFAGGGREDKERDRRLEPGEHERIMAVIEVGVLPRKLRHYALPDKDAVRLLYVLALESAMRLSEMFTLTVDQVQIPRRTIFLERTKNGDKRQVPMSSVAKAELEAYMQGRDFLTGRLFPWWDGKPDTIRATSDFLSKLFVRGIFKEAGCPDLKFHDLRHEATSRLFERTSLSESQIMKVTGHRSHRMMMRYANLRGSDLAAKMW